MAFYLLLLACNGHYRFNVGDPDKLLVFAFEGCEAMPQQRRDPNGKAFR
jgi:hypothetical protein